MVFGSVGISYHRRGPSGPSIEGPFCCAVRLCRALESEKIEKIKKENEETVAKALHGQRFPMPPCWFLRCEQFSLFCSKGAAAP